MNSTEKKNVNIVKIWAVCLDTVKDIWVAHSVLNNRIIMCSGKQSVGREAAYNSLSDELSLRG